MLTESWSRRGLVEIGAAMVVGATVMPASAFATSSDGQDAADEAVVRAYYKAWETKDWAPFDAILANDFTFTSANDDDHISKAAFKKDCWDTQIDFIQNFDLEVMMSKPGEVFVKYLCHTKNGKSFRNVEYHRVRDRRIASIECYFGGKSTFASAVAAQPS